MRNFRDRIRAQGAQTVMASKLINGPDPTKMTEILKRTGYTLEITVGQRKYGGPCPDWDGPPTGPAGQGHEVRALVPFALCMVYLTDCFRSTSAIFLTSFTKTQLFLSLRHVEEFGIFDL